MRAIAAVSFALLSCDGDSPTDGTTTDQSVSVGPIVGLTTPASLYAVLTGIAERLGAIDGKVSGLLDAQSTLGARITALEEEVKRVGARTAVEIPTAGGGGLTIQHALDALAADMGKVADQVDGLQAESAELSDAWGYASECPSEATRVQWFCVDTDVRHSPFRIAQLKCHSAGGHVCSRDEYGAGCSLSYGPPADAQVLLTSDYGEASGYLLIHVDNSCFTETSLAFDQFGEYDYRCCYDRLPPLGGL